MRWVGGRGRRTRFRQNPEPLPRQFVQCPDPEPRPQFRQPPFRRLLDQMGVAAAVERTPGRPGRNRGEEMPASDPRQILDYRLDAVRFHMLEPVETYQQVLRLRR